jgi:hypothetical protein
VKDLHIVTGWKRIRTKRILRRRKIRKMEIFQPFQDMLEAIIQTLEIMLGVLMVSSSLKIRISISNSLVGFARVITFSRISLVFPRS